MNENFAPPRDNPASMLGLLHGYSMNSSRTTSARHSRASILTPASRFSETERLHGVKRMARAARKDELEELRALCELGYDLDWVDENGENALMAAADYGSAHCVEFLLNRTRVPDATSKQDMSAAMLAASHGHSDSLRLLLEAGCDPNRADQSGITALMLAAMSNLRCVNLLLGAGCPVDALCLYGRSAAMYAARAGKLDCLTALVDAGADVERIDSFGVSLFESAKHHSTCVPYLNVQLERVALGQHVGSPTEQGKHRPVRI